MSRPPVSSFLMVLVLLLASGGLGRLAAAQQTDPELDPALVGRGEDLYIENCQPCHGTEGKGDGPAARFLESRPRDLTAARWMYMQDGSLASIRNIVAVGVPGTDMEPFDEILTADEMDAIAAYVYAEIVPRQE